MISCVNLLPNSTTKYGPFDNKMFDILCWLLHENIDQTLVNSLYCLLNLKQVDKSVVLLQQSINHVSIEYIVTPIL